MKYKITYINGVIFEIETNDINLILEDLNEQGYSILNLKSTEVIEDDKRIKLVYYENKRNN